MGFLTGFALKLCNALVTIGHFNNIGPCNP